MPSEEGRKRGVTSCGKTKRKKGVISDLLKKPGVGTCKDKKNSGWTPSALIATQSWKKKLERGTSAAARDRGRQKKESSARLDTQARKNRERGRKKRRGNGGENTLG